MSTCQCVLVCCHWLKHPAQARKNSQMVNVRFATRSTFHCFYL